MSDRQTYLRHPLEIAPLVFGLIFLGIVVAWGLFQLDVVSGADAAWILPIVLITAGALGIVLAATKDRRTRRRYENMYVTAPIGAPWPTGTDERLDDTATSEYAVPSEDTTTTEIRDPDDAPDHPADHPTDSGKPPDHPVDTDHANHAGDADDTDDRNQPGATR